MFPTAGQKSQGGVSVYKDRFFIEQSVGIRRNTVLRSI